MWPGISSQRGRKCPNGPRAEMHRGDWKVSRLKTGGERELPGRRVLNGIKAIAPMVNGNKNVQTQMLSWTCSPQLESCEHRSAEAQKLLYARSTCILNAANTYTYGASTKLGPVELTKLVCGPMKMGSTHRAASQPLTAQPRFRLNPPPTPCTS